MRCTPTTSLSAVFCRTSSARSAPRNEHGADRGAVGDLERVQLGRAPDDDRVAVPRNQLRERAPVRAHRGRLEQLVELRRGGARRRASRRRSRHRSRETDPPTAGCPTSYTRSYWVPVSSRSPTSHAGQRLGYTQSMPPSATDGAGSSSGQTSRSCGSGCDGSAVSRVNASVRVFQKNRSPKSRPGSAWWPDIGPRSPPPQPTRRPARPPVRGHPTLQTPRPAIFMFLDLELCGKVVCQRSRGPGRGWAIHESKYESQTGPDVINRANLVVDQPGRQPERPHVVLA